jgi:hypothetical protein
VVLGLFGIGVALLGGLVFSAQKGLWLFLGLLYLALSVTVITSTPACVWASSAACVSTSCFRSTAITPWGWGSYSVCVWHEVASRARDPFLDKGLDLALPGGFCGPKPPTKPAPVLLAQNRQDQHKNELRPTVHPPVRLVKG